MHLLWRLCPSSRHPPPLSKQSCNNLLFDQRFISCTIVVVEVSVNRGRNDKHNLPKDAHSSISSKLVGNFYNYRSTIRLSALTISRQFLIVYVKLNQFASKFGHELRVQQKYTSMERFNMFSWMSAITQCPNSAYLPTHHYQFHADTPETTCPISCTKSPRPRVSVHICPNHISYKSQHSS